MNIALAQINCTVGDFAGNVARIVAAAGEAMAGGAAILLTPELALCGYPPEDLLLREDFLDASDDALQGLVTAIPQDLTLVIGHPLRADGACFNAATVWRGGRCLGSYRKQRLPNHSVFDEVRYFTSGQSPCVFEQDGVRFGVNICADVWESGAAGLARQAGAEVLLVLNASPFHRRKLPARHGVMRERAGETGVPALYCNLVGGQDELVFDGASFAMDARGRVMQQFPAFVERVGLVELERGRVLPGEICGEPETEASVYRALCLGLGDYVRKNRFPGIVLGLSGGIDSALTLALAVDALGADRVHAVMMPSCYTAGISVEDARAMAEGLGVRYTDLSIGPAFEVLLQTLAPVFGGCAVDTTEENIQARIRGLLLMAISNKFGALVVTTGNKSEMAVGYATLYGDMAGGFAVLKDVPKTLVYRLADWRNCEGRVIPQRIIDRPPSAELRPDQTDQDSLPPYPVLDTIMEAYVENDLSPDDIVRMGQDAEAVRRVVSLIDRNEYKRRQAPVGVRVTPRAFGRDRRYPITSRFEPVS